MSKHEYAIKTIGVEMLSPRRYMTTVNIVYDGHTDIRLASVFRTDVVTKTTEKRTHERRVIDATRLFILSEEF